MDTAVKRFIELYQLQNIVKVAITRKRTFVSLRYGQDEDGTKWYYDVDDKLEEKLMSMGIRKTYDWPHAGNGFTVDAFHTELWWDARIDLYKLFKD
jgi:hypothetical protein